jgi:alkylation response protein AidB-like acyl-CoA dehydrogenase
MTSVATRTLNVPVGLAAARKRLGPVLATIASRAAERDLDRSLAFEEVRLLAEAGFGALRLPVERATVPGGSVPRLKRKAEVAA